MAGSPRSADIPESRCRVHDRDCNMPFTLRPTGLSSRAYRDWADYIVIEDGRANGRMYDDRRGREQRSPKAWSAPSNPRSLTKQIQPASDRTRGACVHFTAAISMDQSSDSVSPRVRYQLKICDSLDKKEFFWRTTEDLTDSPGQLAERTRTFIGQLAASSAFAKMRPSVERLRY